MPWLCRLTDGFFLTLGVVPAPARNTSPSVSKQPEIKGQRWLWRVRELEPKAWWKLLHERKMQELNLMVHGKLVIAHNGCAAKEEESSFVHLQAHSASLQLLHVAQSWLFASEGALENAVRWDLCLSLCLWCELTASQGGPMPADGKVNFKELMHHLILIYSRSLLPRLPWGMCGGELLPHLIQVCRPKWKQCCAKDTKRSWLQSRDLCCSPGSPAWQPESWL